MSDARAVVADGKLTLYEGCSILARRTQDNRWMYHYDRGLLLEEALRRGCVIGNADAFEISDLPPSVVSAIRHSSNHRDSARFVDRFVREPDGGKAEWAVFWNALETLCLGLSEALRSEAADTLRSIRGDPPWGEPPAERIEAVRARLRELAPQLGADLRRAFSAVGFEGETPADQAAAGLSDQAPVAPEVAQEGAARAPGPWPLFPELAARDRKPAYITIARWRDDVFVLHDQARFDPEKLTAEKIAELWGDGNYKIDVWESGGTLLSSLAMQIDNQAGSSPFPFDRDKACAASVKDGVVILHDREEAPYHCGTWLFDDLYKLLTEADRRAMVVPDASFWCFVGLSKELCKDIRHSAISDHAPLVRRVARFSKEPSGNSTDWALFWCAVGVLQTRYPISGEPVFRELQSARRDGPIGRPAEDEIAAISAKIKRLSPQVETMLRSEYPTAFTTQEPEARAPGVRVPVPDVPGPTGVAVGTATAAAGNYTAVVENSRLTLYCGGLVQTRRDCRDDPAARAYLGDLWFLLLEAQRRGHVVGDADAFGIACLSSECVSQISSYRPPSGDVAGVLARLLGKPDHDSTGWALFWTTIELLGRRDDIPPDLAERVRSIRGTLPRGKPPADRLAGVMAKLDELSPELLAALQRRFPDKFKRQQTVAAAEVPAPTPVPGEPWSPGVMTGTGFAFDIMSVGIRFVEDAAEVKAMEEKQDTRPKSDDRDETAPPVLPVPIDTLAKRCGVEFVVGDDGSMAVGGSSPGEKTFSVSDGWLGNTTSLVLALLPAVACRFLGLVENAARRTCATEFPSDIISSARSASTVLGEALEMLRPLRSTPDTDLDVDLDDLDRALASFRAATEAEDALMIQVASRDLVHAAMHLYNAARPLLSARTAARMLTDLREHLVWAQRTLREYFSTRSATLREEGDDCPPTAYLDGRAEDAILRVCSDAWDASVALCGRFPLPVSRDDDEPERRTAGLAVYTAHMVVHEITKTALQFRHLTSFGQDEADRFGELLGERLEGRMVALVFAARSLDVLAGREEEAEAERERAAAEVAAVEAASAVPVIAPALVGRVAAEARSVASESLRRSLARRLTRVLSATVLGVAGEVLGPRKRADLAALRGFLEGPVGRSLLQSIGSLAVEGLPLGEKLAELQRAAAHELRVEALAGLGDAFLSKLGGEVVQALESVMASEDAEAALGTDAGNESEPREVGVRAGTAEAAGATEAEAIRPDPQASAGAFA
jgi:hypothetical protein